MTLTIDVTVTGPDGTTSSGSVTVDVTQPPAAAALNEEMRQRSRALRWGAGRA